MTPRRALCLAAVVAAVALPTAAVAAPTTRVIEGEHIRIESTADWERMARLAPGESVAWTLAISVDAPDPGTLDIGVRGTGGLDLVADIATCGVAWQGAECPEGAEVLRADWALPLDGATDWLRSSGTEDPVFVRLDVSLAPSAVESAEAEVSVHVRAAGDEVFVDQDDERDLSPTGGSAAPLLLAAGAVLVGGGVAALARGRRARRSPR
ncbi:hypothetical protein [Microbacterium sp. KNMS]